MRVECADIFLVEDDDDDLYLFKKAVENAQLSCTIKRFTNGYELLEYLSLISQYEDVSWPKVILLDLNMPGFDGRETLKVIFDEPKYRHLPTIIYTTSTNHQDIIDCYKNGAKSYIVKSTSIEELTMCVKNLTNYWFETVTLL